MKILLIRIKNLNQYNNTTQTIVWEDATLTRWQTYYNTLVVGDKVIATVAGQRLLFIGTISNIAANTNITISNVTEVSLKNDELLRLNEIYPEKVSRMKANFQPFIPAHAINWNQLLAEINQKQLIDFYIVKSESFNQLVAQNTFKSNDRIAIIKDGKFDEFGSFNNGIITPLNDTTDLYNVKGKTLQEVLTIQEQNINPLRTRGSNKVKLVKNIINELNSKPYFTFSSFFTYYDILHNKSLYLNIDDTETEDDFADYYVVGTSWGGGTNDQAERFYANGIWENGRDEQEDQDAVNNVPVNTRLAVKSSFAQKGKSIFRVKRYGTVTENPNDGQTLKVDWDEPMDSFDIISHVAGRYSGTLHQVKDEDINAIFYPENSKSESTNNKKNNSNMETIGALNTILFGPPGTGKTYNTIDAALQIVAKQEYLDTLTKYANNTKEQRDAVVSLFNKYLVKSVGNEKINWETTQGKIAFCTFHQSFSYEDFIEGIKPNTDGDTKISYTIEDGVFKHMCNLSNRGSVSTSQILIPSNARFTKLKLNTKSDLEYCLNNNIIGLTIGVKSNQEIYFKNSLNNSPQYSHVVLLTTDNVTVNAIAIVKGETKVSESGSFSFTREVEWIKRECDISLSSIYESDVNNDTIDALDEKLVKKVIEEQLKTNADNSNFVLIIDEINRGNVSQIFGELITLIESDKRKGTANELSAILPYSKKSFSVPKNLYIVGTMNTADRSVEALDTALRRRFDFIEMPPNYNKLKGLTATVNNKPYDLELLLKTINKRLQVLLTKDHQIGHSYFLRINNEVSLQEVFKNNIVPLLQEYFYGDFAKVCMVLGKDFITANIAKDENKTTPFFAYSKHDSTEDFLEKEVWNLNESIFDKKNETAFAKAIDNLLNPTKEVE